jgi:hypothetical protein
MKIVTRRIALAAAGFTLATLAALALGAKAMEPLKVDFSDETVGAEPKSFLSVVGVWRIESDGNNKVLVVDGRQWKEGQASAGLADKARALYGDRYAEFLDRVQAYAYFPYVVAKDVNDFRNGEISVRFEGISGRIDQGAGILFNLKPNGDYLTVRANPLENNLVLWKFEKGRRSSVNGSAIRRRLHASGTTSRCASTVPRSKPRSTASVISSTPGASRSPAASACGRKPTATCTSTTTP